MYSFDVHIALDNISPSRSREARLREEARAAEKDSDRQFSSRAITLTRVSRPPLDNRLASATGEQRAFWLPMRNERSPARYHGCVFLAFRTRPAQTSDLRWLFRCIILTHKRPGLLVAALQQPGRLC